MDILPGEALGYSNTSLPGVSLLLQGGVEVLDGADVDLGFVGRAIVTNDRSVIRGGTLKAANITVGDRSSAGTLRQSGGHLRLELADSLFERGFSGASINVVEGSFILDGGSITFVDPQGDDSEITVRAGGTFVQNDVDLAFHSLRVGGDTRNVPADARYELHGGSVTTRQFIQWDTALGESRFIQTGGLHTTARLVIGSTTGEGSTYQISGGAIDTVALVVGDRPTNGAYAIRTDRR